MPVKPAARAGERLRVKERLLPFSFWPTRPSKNHVAIQSMLFSLDPWSIIRQAIERELEGDRRLEALSYADQAHDFFTMGTGGTADAARPLALYYAYMNLVKAICLVHDEEERLDLSIARHGLQAIHGGGGPANAHQVKAFVSPDGRQRPQNFDEFLRVLTDDECLDAAVTYRLRDILPQILPGHRLWSQAAGEKERFIAFDDIQYWCDRDNRHLWLRLYVYSDDLKRLGHSAVEFLRRSRLKEHFRMVDAGDAGEERTLLCFEELEPWEYEGQHPADGLEMVSHHYRNKLWMTVATVPPYRRFYAYVPPSGEPIPQLASIFALSFLFGDMVRYRPLEYEALLKGEYGPRVGDFVSGQPMQFLYLIASLFAKQDVTRPSIV